MAITRSTLQLLRRLQVAIGTAADAAVRSLTSAWTRSWDELSGAWQHGLSDTVAQAAARGQWPSAWELGRVERLRQASIASEEALLKLGHEAGITIRDGAGQIITATARAEPHLIASQLPAVAQAEAAARAGSRITPTALSAIVARTQGQIESAIRPLSGAASEAMRRELIRGVAVGDNPRKAASAMTTRVQGAFEGGLVRATTIARTEMLDAYRATSTLAHTANADVVSGWIWHAQLDARTCPSCWSMHGSVHPADQPGPWDHPQGRCARVPKTRTWRELGFDIDEPDDTIVNARNRFFSLPDADQRTIMGPGRLALLRSGRVDWSDIPMLRPSTAWRPSYAPRTVFDLERVARVRAVGGRVPELPVPTAKVPRIAEPKAGGPPLPTPDARMAAAAKGPDALDAVPYRRGTLPRTERVGTSTAGEIDDALSDYSQGHWMGINQDLRKGILDDPRTADRIRHIDAAMADSTTRTEILVTRGVPKPGDIFGEGWLDRDLVGFEWLDGGFVSTTANVGATGRTFFTGTSGVRMQVLVPKGTGAAVISDIGETELLLNRGLGFRVIRDRGLIDGIRHLDVEVLPAAARALPSAVAADPALKMTVAALKKIAKDNNVPLNILGTRKAEIVQGLRDWERTYVVKLKGLPEWKPPPVVRPTGFENTPPLGVPPTGRPTLTGSSLNDWADYFRHDLEQGRHQFVDKAGDTVAEGVRVKDLRVHLAAYDGSYPEYVVAEGTAWRFDGVAYLIEHGPKDYGAPWVSRALTELRAAHQAVPGAVRANKSYTVLLRNNPADVYWQRKFNNPKHTAAMSAGDGHISVWHFSPDYGRIELQVDSLRHETAHNLDSLIGRTTAGSESPAWAAAADADAVWAAKIRDLTPTHHEATKLATVEPTRGYPKGVTQYGRSSAGEDYAESVMLYQLGPIATGRLGSEAGRVLYFRDIYPKRAAILDKLFPDIAKAQKAEIAALRGGAAPAYAQREAAVRAIYDAPGGSVKVLRQSPGAKVSLKTSPDGQQRVILKDFTSAAGPERLDAEELSARVASALGVRAPAVARISRSRITTEFIDGRTGEEILGSTRAPVPTAMLETAEGRRMGLMDVLIGNSDRSASNWMIADGRLVSIDHADAFRLAADGRLYGGSSPFAQYLVTSRGGRMVWRSDTGLGQADLAKVRTELEKLRPEFVARGRVDWYDAMLTNLDEITRAVGAPDLSKMLVKDLRALATQRGIKIPTGAKKADIVALLDKKPLTGNAAIRAAARERNRQIEQATGTAKLLAHVDELIAKKADLSVIRQSLDPKLIKPEQIFANADAKVLAALRKALDSGDLTKLRAAVTRASTTAKIKPISRAGVKVKYDPDTMEPFAGDIKPGTPVTVVRRGSSVTLPDGTVMQLEKARVTTVTEKLKLPPPAEKVPAAELARAKKILGSDDARAIYPWDLSDIRGFFGSRADERWIKGFADQHPETFMRLVQDGHLRRSYSDWRAYFGVRGTASEVRARMVVEMRKQISAAPIMVRRARESSLRDILERGRMRTQFETGSSGGTLNTQLRSRYEQMAFGYATDLNPTLRPVYGYLAVGKDGLSDAVSQYGTIRIRLKESVRSRTSFTVADSLGGWKQVLPTPVDEPGWQSFNVTPGTGYRAPGGLGRDYGSSEFRRSNYVEAQIHGGVTVDDIEEVIFGGQPEQATIDALRRADIPWRIE